VSVAILRKAASFLRQPGAYFRYQPRKARKLYHSIARVMHPRTYFSRCFGGVSNDNLSLSIDPDKGYAVYRPDDTAGLNAQAVIDEVQRILKDKDIEAIRKASTKPYLVRLMEPDEIEADSEIFRFVSHPSILGAVRKYLKCDPLLTYVSVWYSPNDGEQAEGSQKYHLDHEDFRQIKGFLYIEDVAPENGPFTLVPADSSHKIEDALNYKATEESKRVEDEDVQRIAGADQETSLTGEKGTLALVDTSACFHYGSRKGKKPRLVLTFQYMTPFAFVMPWMWTRKHYMARLRRQASTPEQKKLLGIVP